MLTTRDVKLANSIGLWLYYSVRCGKHNLWREEHYEFSIVVIKVEEVRMIRMLMINTQVLMMLHLGIVLKSNSPERVNDYR